MVKTRGTCKGKRICRVESGQSNGTGRGMIKTDRATTLLGTAVITVKVVELKAGLGMFKMGRGVSREDRALL